MLNTTKTVRRMFIIAGLSVIAASASALSIDPQIMIDRALDSPTLTIRYTGVVAALVELKVNGESIGTRTVSATKNAGETNFTLNLSELKDGDNDVEVRLFDRTGKLVAHDHTNISTEPVQRGPVFLSAPKMGATVMGPVEINVGFGKKFKGAYVSFFIDGNFKSVSNVPPYSYVWDTEREARGWHELEAWAIDDTNTTNKTRKVRVFVNNPGGNTDRIGVTVNPSLNKSATLTLPEPTGALKNVTLRPSSRVAPSARLVGVAPVLHPQLSTKSNSFEPVLGAPANEKPIAPAGSYATGPRHLLPTGRRVATFATQNPGVPRPALASKRKTQEIVAITTHVAAPVQAQATTGVVTAASLLRITKGVRIHNLGSFEISYNKSFIDFDVAPRVDDGIPMTPFRYLFEKAGGSVSWENLSKQVTAKSEGHFVRLKIGDSVATVNKLAVTLERSPYLDHGRTIVPLSFIHDALSVDVEYDKETGHVLITSVKK